MTGWFDESGVFFAKAGTSFDDMMKDIIRTKDFYWSINHGAGYMPMSVAQGELLYRVNARIKGEDPGEPMNWKGERAFTRRNT